MIQYIMTEERVINPAIQQEINDVKKRISERNMTEKLKEQFENMLKDNGNCRRTMESLKKLFDDSEMLSYEDAFRALGGEEFAKANENEELDSILRNLAKLKAEELTPEEKHDLFKQFLNTYINM